MRDIDLKICYQPIAVKSKDIAIHYNTRGPEGPEALT